MQEAKFRQELELYNASMMSLTNQQKLEKINTDSGDVAHWGLISLEKYAQHYCNIFANDMSLMNELFSDLDNNCETIKKLYASAAYCGNGYILSATFRRAKDIVEDVKLAHNRTALMMASHKGHADCVEILLLYPGCQMQDIYGFTALICAACMGHAECVKLLIEKEGRMQDRIGRTALMRAASCNKEECVKLLFEKEGKMQDRDCWTALMYAASCVFQGVLLFLWPKKEE